MTANSLLQLALYPLILVAAAWPLGLYMAKVYQQQPTGPRRWLAPLENRLYRLAGVVPEAEMSWQAYAKALLLFSAVGVLALYALERCQGLLPANPQGLGAVAPDLALNTAVSFVTNTNWQAYAGESAQSYLSQMLGLAVQNFLSAASGMAVLVALVRGLSRRCQATVGNFWVDLTRSVLYILLPLSLVLALVLVALGVPQTFAAYPSVAPLEATQAGGADSGPQLLALGPVASQAAIQHLGTNGGGFFNTNSAHPFANPSPLSDFLLLLAMTVIPARGATIKFKYPVHFEPPRDAVTRYGSLARFEQALAVGMLADGTNFALLPSLRPASDNLEAALPGPGTYMVAAPRDVSR